MDRETAEEINRHFNVVAEGLRSEIRIVAEGLPGFRDEASAEFKAVREKVAETKALIRLSFGEKSWKPAPATDGSAPAR